MPWGNSLKQHLNSVTRAKSSPIKAPHLCPVLSPPCPSLICSPQLLCRSPSPGGGWDWRMYAWVWSYWTGTVLLMIVWQEAWQAAEDTARVRGVDFCPLSSPHIYDSFIPTPSLSLFFLCLDCSFNLSYSSCHTLTHLLFETQLSVCTRPEASCLFKTDIWLLCILNNGTETEKHLYLW